MRFWIYGLLVITMTAIALRPLSQGNLPSDVAQERRQNASLVASASEFLKTLSDEQKAKAVLTYENEKRVQWHFIPMETRKGLPLMEMEAAQKQAALQLLRSAVSKAGFDKATKIMSLESVLRKLEGPDSHQRRNPEKYYFTLFGEPGENSHWGLSIEGHHLSLNFVMQGEKIIDSTPQFFATNPAELKDSYGEGFEKGLRVLQEEEQLGFDLLAALDADQKKHVMIPGDVPQEIRAAGTPQPPTDAAVGIVASALKPDQKELLKQLITAYTVKMRPGVAKQRWELIDNAGFDKIKFAWAGGDRAGVGHYYRVQGETFLIEFINVQADAAGNPANHVHCVWRDMQGDFDLPIAAK